MVVESANLDVFRFNRTGDKDLGEEGDGGKLERAISPKSIFVNTFLKGGSEVGFCLAVGDSASSGTAPNAELRSGEVSTAEAGFLARFHIMIVPSKPVLTMVVGPGETVPTSPRQAMSLIPSVCPESRPNRARFRSLYTRIDLSIEQ